VDAVNEGVRITGPGVERTLSWEQILNPPIYGQRQGLAIHRQLVKNLPEFKQLPRAAEGITDDRAAQALQVAPRAYERTRIILLKILNVISNNQDGAAAASDCIARALGSLNMHMIRFIGGDYAVLAALRKLRRLQPHKYGLLWPCIGWFHVLLHFLIVIFRIEGHDLL
jgi:hypothetical protein